MENKLSEDLKKQLNFNRENINYLLAVREETGRLNESRLICERLRTACEKRQINHETYQFIYNLIKKAREETSGNAEVVLGSTLL